MNCLYVQPLNDKKAFKPRKVRQGRHADAWVFDGAAPLLVRCPLELAQRGFQVGSPGPLRWKRARLLARRSPACPRERLLRAKGTLQSQIPLPLPLL